ncbi:hypothetical protein [Nocardia jiangxiensis]|uniref:hypothetical protein n=1 Tax=Nocardia jiangxiensis TaxID=282685 RepID=UPI0012F63FCD|nr:hypothetical protein [Nocardia jiangxiensis]
MNPVRSVLYTIIVGIVAVVFAKFGISDTAAIDALIAIVLGVPATELIRSQVTPVAKLTARK